MTASMARYLAFLMTFNSCLVVALMCLYRGAALQNDQPLGPPRPFDYVLTSHCPTNTDVIFWVHTRPSSFGKRAQIRNSWGNGKHLRQTWGYNSSLRFFVGLTEDKTATDVLTYESEKYGDIVQEAYVDSYYNLTYKAMSGVRWISNKCAVSRLVTVVKADDDTAINVARVLNSVNKKQKLQDVRKTIYCPDVLKAKVRRDGSKWSVPRSQFAPNYYPPYCQGLFILLSPDVLPMLAKQAEVTPFFWIDDVYLTGLLRQPLGVNLRSIIPQFQEWPEFDQPFPVCTHVVHTYFYSERLYQHFWRMVQPEKDWPSGEHPSCA